MEFSVLNYFLIKMKGGLMNALLYGPGGGYGDRGGKGGRDLLDPDKVGQDRSKYSLYNILTFRLLLSIVEMFKNLSGMS